jgi:hypothetical protein
MWTLELVCHIGPLSKATESTGIRVNGMLKALVSPIGRNSGVLIGGEPHQNSGFRSFRFLRSFCAAKAGFDGLNSVVLVRFHQKYP